MRAPETSKQYRHWLIEDYSRRRERNAGYSLRAFARDLKVSKTALSDVLSGRRDFSKKAAVKVAQALTWSPKRTAVMLNEVARGSSATSLKTDSVDRTEFLQLQEDQFKLICEWYHIAILNLARLKRHSADPKWIARRLGISEVEAKGALNVLERLVLIEIKREKIVRTSAPVKAGGDEPSTWIRKYHRQNLRLAEESLERDPITRRVVSALSFPMNAKTLPLAEKKIAAFKHEMAELFETPNTDDVYTISIQLFPVTRGEKT